MIEKELTVQNPKGIHARPCALIATAMKPLDATVSLIKGNQVADAKVILNIMSMVTKYQDTVLVRAEGPDEQKAIAALEEIFAITYDD